MDKPKSKPTPLKLLLKIGISIALLVYLFTSTGFEKTLAELSHANLWLIIPCVALYLIAQILSAYRWKTLANALNMSLSLREFYDYYLIGMYFSLFLPSAIGGDVGRIYYLSKATGRKKRESLLTIAAERGSGLAALLLLSSAACLTPIGQVVPETVKLTIYGLTVAGILVFIALQCLPVDKWLLKIPKLSLFAQANIYWKNWPLLAGTIGMSLLYHFLMVVIHMIIGQALGISVSPWYLAMTYGVVSLISVIPITFNGIGLREGAYQYLLGNYGHIPEHTGLAFGLYWFVISTLTSLAGGIVLVKGHYKTPANEDLNDSELE